MQLPRELTEALARHARSQEHAQQLVLELIAHALADMDHRARLTAEMQAAHARRAAGR